MEEVDLEILVKQVHENLSIDTLSNFIRQVKKHNSSGYTEIIAAKGIEVLSKNSKLTSVDYFDVLEEIYLSVIELKLQDWALVILQILN